MLRLAWAISSMHARGQARRLLGLLSTLWLGCVLAGCSTGPQTMALASAGSGATLSFESIDGPPPQVFDRLVSALNSESAGKPFTVVGRGTAASYHVRGYLSAQVRRGQSVIAWVFDTYDGNQQRAFRLSGEEVAGKTGRDAWNAADDQLLRRIAQAGMNGLSAVLSGNIPEPAAEPAARGPLLADSTPSGAGTTAGQALGFSNH